MRLSQGCLVIALLACPAMATAQTVQVNQQNRTIEIAATSSIQVTADFVTITLGYHNYGPTHDAAFADNARIAAQILKAWTGAGLSQKEIATSALTSRFTSEIELRGMSPDDRKQKVYEVDQSWKITQKIDIAEKLLDVAVDAGANYVGGCGTWLIPTRRKRRPMRPLSKKHEPSPIQWPSHLARRQERCFMPATKPDRPSLEAASEEVSVAAISGLEKAAPPDRTPSCCRKKSRRPATFEPSLRSNDHHHS
jgi:hypothetical protein